MPVTDEFVRYALEQLAALGRIASRRMFGGVGLYHEGVFFGLIDDDTLYLKVNADTRADYVSRGMKPFCPYPDRPGKSMGYYEVPADIIEEGAELAAWSRKACAAALASRKPGVSARKNKPAHKRTASRPRRVVKRRAVKRK